MALRLIRLAAATVVLFALWTPDAWAEDAPRNTKPFTRFKILLSSEFFNDTLPFDVPFILWGDLPPGTEVGALEPTGVTLRIPREGPLGHFVDTTGVPTASASIRTKPRPSHREVNASRPAWAMYG